MATVSLNTIIKALPPSGSRGPIARVWRMIGYGGRRCYSCRTSLVTHVIPAIGKRACAKCAEELERVHPSHHRTDTSTHVSSDGGAATSAKPERVRREAQVARLQAQATRRQAQAARCQSRMLRAEAKASLTEMHTKVTAAVEWAADQQWPARRLWAVSTTAAEHAAGDPQRAKDLARPAFATSGDAQARGGDRAPAEPGSNQEVPAVIQPDDWGKRLEELPVLTQDDLDVLHTPVATHGWRVITICEGYTGDCSCGWRSAETDYLVLTLHQVKDHLDSVRQAHRRRDAKEPGGIARARELGVSIQSQQNRQADRSALR